MSPCPHLRRRLTYFKHSLYARMSCRDCNADLGQLIGPNHQNNFRGKTPLKKHNTEKISI
jgi:hypothetical protein